MRRVILYSADKTNLKYPIVNLYLVISLILMILLTFMYSAFLDIFYRPQTKFAKVMFSHVSVCPQRGGSPGPHLGGVEGSGLGGGVSRPTPRGVSRPTPGGVSRPTPRGVSQHALRQTPPSRRLLLRAVRILLECILVSVYFPFACQEINYVLVTRFYSSFYNGHFPV